MAAASDERHGARASTGVTGLDEILDGGLTPDRMYLLEGNPGTGKTTFALRFLMAGVEAGEPGLYVTLSETAAELRGVVASHGWTLDGITLHELTSEVATHPDEQQSILHPAEIELGEIVANVMREVERSAPRRVVLDSLSEMRLLAQDPLYYRRQVLAFKQFFAQRGCTVLLLDGAVSQGGDLQLHSIAHGVITLDQTPHMFGTERRHLRVVKMRGVRFQGGVHDLALDTGRVEVYPRLVAAAHRRDYSTTAVSTGSDELDAMLGGGLVPGSNTLLLGPSGIGKTTTAVRCVLTALQRGERAVYYLFDESLNLFIARGRQLGMDLEPYLAGGQLVLKQVDPASMSPGEFAHDVLKRVIDDGCHCVVIDSLNAYLLAMPGATHLLLHMHELLSFLNQQGVTALLVVGQHGLLGEVRTDIDLSYLSDSIVLYRFFEAAGTVRAAVSVVKSRGGANLRDIREFRLSQARGVQVGEPLDGFEGVMTGTVAYRGATPMLTDESHR